MSVMYMGNKNHILCEKMMENTWIFGTVRIFCEKNDGEYVDIWNGINFLDTLYIFII